MQAHRLTPILNVSDIEQSFAWFEKLGFLCLNGQGGRGKSTFTMTFGPDSDEGSEKGVWMSMWVDDVDAVYQRCLDQGLEVTWPPTDMPWNVREMHVRHPDGHVFRISRGREEGGT